jgi:hypothetical protein
VTSGWYLIRGTCPAVPRLLFAPLKEQIDATRVRWSRVGLALLDYDQRRWRRAALKRLGPELVW